MSEDKLSKVLDYVTKEEDRYYEMASREMERNNMPGLYYMAQSQASAFQRVRYFIEELYATCN